MGFSMNLITPLTYFKSMWKTSSKRRLPVQTLNHIELQRGLVYKNTYTELSIYLKNLEDFC